MINVLFISDDTRTAQLIEQFQPNFKARMKLAYDFDQGLKDVFDNRPSAVFIQSDISGISGETVARHIKTLLRNEAPMVILIHSVPLKAQVGKKWFDDTIDFSLPSLELNEAFKQKLIMVGPDQWQDTPGTAEGKDEEAIPGSADAPEEASSPPEMAEREFEPFDWETPVDVPVPPAGPAAVPELSADLAPTPDQVQPPSPPPVPVSEEKPVPPPKPQDEPKPRMSLETDVSPEHVEPPMVVPPPAPHRDMPPFEPSPQAIPSAEFSAAAADHRGKTKEGAIPFPREREFAAAPRTGRTIGICIAAVILLVVSVGVHYALKKSHGTAPLPKAQGTVSAPSLPVPPSKPSVPARTSVRLTKLPSFVPAKSRDNAFPRGNPGWERYRGGGREYRVFREGGTIRAIQVISSDKSGIGESFLMSVTKELAGSEARTVVSRQEKGGYVVESGNIAGAAEVVVYRKKGGAIKAFVVSLPK